MTNLPFTGYFTVTAYNGMVMSSGKIHDGMDLVGNNPLIYGICNGTVVRKRLLNNSYGYHIFIKDNDTGYLFVLAHFSEIYVNENDSITRTTILGKMGHTGNATGDHVHIEMFTGNYENRSPVNHLLAGYLGIPGNTTGTYNSNDFQITPPEPIPNMMYAAHCQNLGWQEEKRNGEMAGLYGQGLRVEAIIINADINIQYRVHMAEKGWSDWVPNGCMAGTIGESRAIEAIEIQSSKNVIVGQAYVENIGYQNEVRGTQITIGTTGQALRIEGFRLKFE